LQFINLKEPIIRTNKQKKKFKTEFRNKYQ
jgi:hypothetical protein